MVLDGVLDSDYYYESKSPTFPVAIPERYTQNFLSSAEWNNLNDTDKAIDFFYTLCSSAGQDRCAFWASTPEEIESNLHALYDQAREQPIPVYPTNGSLLSYGIIDYETLHLTVFDSLYSPYTTWPALAEALAALQQGDPAPFWEYYQTAADANGTYSSVCSAPDPDPEFVPASAAADAGQAITCNDGKEIPNTWEDSVYQLERAVGLSEWGGLSADVRIGCSGWPRLAKGNFQGTCAG
jgi:hypothetical protein